MNLYIMLETWIKALTKPRETLSEEELAKPHTNLRTGVIWLATAFGIGSVISSIVHLLTDGPSYFIDRVPEVIAGFGVGGLIVVTFLFSITLGVIGSLIISGLFFFIAKLFGGTGSFGQQTYLFAAFTAPVTIISMLLNIFPTVSNCLSPLLSVYEIALVTLAIRISHKLTGGKAIGAVLVIILPLIVGVIVLILYSAGQGPPPG